MGLSNALYAGLTGLSANSQSIAVTSDNISNSNTVGYRGSRTSFEDLLTRSVLGVGELGSGVRLAKIEKLFSQGAIIGSARSTDMAINGRGFFVVNGQFDGVEGSFYTRAGNFAPDREGFLVNNDGLRVQGYVADEDGNLSSVPGDIRAAQSVPPSPTEDITIHVNLDSRDEVPVQTFDPTDPAGTSSHSTTVTVYDSLGEPRLVTVYYTRTGPQSWDWNAVADGEDLAGGLTGPQVVANGSLTFDTQGRLVDENTVNNTVDFQNAAPGQVLNFDFGDSINTDGGDGSGSSAFAEAFDVSFLDQDGYGTGELVDMQVTEDGTIQAEYSNGEIRTVARVALASFQSPVGLRRAGGTMFRQTLESGDATIGFANTGGRGAIFGGALEQSNVDISTEFVNLINDQRAFQAATRTITTADELLAETINLKR
jgi:flagellar hook protein FlgE